LLLAWTSAGWTGGWAVRAVERNEGVRRWAEFVLTHRRWVVGLWLLAVVGGAIAAGPVSDRLTHDWSLPGEPGTKTARQINHAFGNGCTAPYLVSVTYPEGQAVAGHRAQVAAGFNAVATKVLSVRVLDEANTGDAAFRTTDGRTANALVFYRYNPSPTAQLPTEQIRAALKAAKPAGSTVGVTGQDALAEGSDTGGPGVFAETLLGAVGALGVLAFVFASLLAMLPLVVAAASILATFALLLPLTYLGDFSAVVQFLIALVGLGVAIDYSLLLVTRWREERGRGRDNHQAVVAAMQTAGHTVLVSGVTVTIGLLALLALPVPWMRSMGIGGALIPLASIAATLSLTPAILGGIGPRVDWPRIRREQAASRAWSGWAATVVQARWLAGRPGDRGFGRARRGIPGHQDRAVVHRVAGQERSRIPGAADAQARRRHHRQHDPDRGAGVDRSSQGGGRRAGQGRWHPAGGGVGRPGQQPWWPDGGGAGARPRDGLAGWASRAPWWPRTLSVCRDLALPLVLLTVQLTGAAITGGTFNLFGPLRPLGAVDWVLLVAGPVALVARRWHPVPALLVCVAVMASRTGFTHLSFVAAFFLAATAGKRYPAWLVLAFAFVWEIWLAPLAYGYPIPPPSDALLLAGWLMALVIAAEATRIRAERAAATRASRQTEQRRRQSEERLRVARDLHDVIGHNISLINVQASIGLDLIDSRPEQARAALSAIKSASKEALEELRTMLTTLRRDDDVAPRSPAPGLDRLPELIELTRTAGLSVELEVSGKAPPLPAAVHLAVYRIIQESLTNVARHAGRARITVRVTYDDADVRVEIDDDGTVPSDGTAAIGTGSGITGMRERATALGGNLSAGFRRGGGFRVSARLPVRPSP